MAIESLETDFNQEIHPTIPEVRQKLVEVVQDTNQIPEHLDYRKFSGAAALG